MQQSVVSKAEFARVAGVTPTRVGQWLREGKINGEALVGDGRHARINIELARRQLDARLDLSQRLGANGKAVLSGASPDPIDAAIKAARLHQLTLANEKARAEALALSGRYVLADDAKREMGKIAGAMIAAFDGVLPSMADDIAAQASIPQREVLLALRSAWRRARVGVAAVEDDAATQEAETLGAAL